MWRFIFFVPVTLLLSFSPSGNASAQTVDLPNLPTGNLPLQDFRAGFAHAYPALAINGFDCNAPGRSCNYGLGFKQILDTVTSQPNADARLLFDAILALADKPLSPVTSRGAIKTNTLIAEARGFVANATLILEANGHTLSTFGLPDHATARAAFEAIIEQPAWTTFDPELSDDAVKWAGPLGSLARATDFFLALEQAYLHYQMDSPSMFACNHKSAWLSHLQQQIQLVDDLGNTSVMDLQFIKIFGYDLASIIRDISYDEVQAGNWPMKVHVAVGYASIPYQLPEASCPTFAPANTYPRWLGRALRSAGGPDKNNRNHHWAYQTGGGQPFWAEGPFYFNYGLTTAIPFWHAARIQNLLQENDDFTLDDPFHATWLTQPLHAFADVATPDGGTPPLEDGNKIPMEAAHLMAWDANYGDYVLGEKFAWIAAAHPNLPSADLWIHALALPRAIKTQPPRAELVPTNATHHPQQLVLRRDGGTGGCQAIPQERTSPCHFLLINGETSDAILPGEGHEQSDQLQLLYYVDGTSYLIDAGYDSAPGILNSTWSDYRQHNVMAADRTGMEGGHGGLPGPVVGLSCTRYVSGLPLPTACMYANHNEVDVWQHQRTGKVDVIQSSLTIFPDARASDDEVLYERTLFFVDDPQAPYLIDINAANARIDSMAQHIALEMNYLGNAPASMIDPSAGGALWHPLWAAPDSLGSVPDTGTDALFIQAQAVETDLPATLRPDIVREIALSGVGNGEGLAVQRLQLSNKTPNGELTPSHTSVAFIQPRPNPAHTYPADAVKVHNPAAIGHRTWQLFSWEHSPATVDIALVRAASAPLTDLQVPFIPATSGAWREVDGFVTEGVSFERATGTLRLDANTKAGYIRLENTALVSGETHLMQPVTSLSNAPNPFANLTTIQYVLDQPQYVMIEVFNMLGQRIDQLVSGFKSAGQHSVAWQPANLPDGVYLYRMRTPNGSITKQMTLRR